MPTNAVPTPDEIWKILKETAAAQKLRRIVSFMKITIERQT